MEKEISLAQGERLHESLLCFVREVENVMRAPAKKPCRAKRSFCDLRGSAKGLLAVGSPLASSLYDTEENRWVSFLLSSVQTHLLDIELRYSFDPAVGELFSLMKDALSKVCAHPCLSGRKMEEGPEDVSKFPECYRKTYHAYVLLKYALAEVESEVEIGLSQVNWEERDVLVGSFGSEKQFHHNLAKKYYYAPERYFDPTCFPIRYVALYQSAHFAESGICYYGEVKAIRRLKRKKIRFGVRRQNGEEDYYLFRVKEWKRLASPIQIQDEGVRAPKYTNLFLLMRCRKTYELFHLGSEAEYRAYHRLLRVLSDVPHDATEKEKYPLENGKSIWVHDGHFEILDEQGKMMRLISVTDFLQYPTKYIDDIFACMAYERAPSELPLWVIRENEAYEEKYGVPYRDDE